ncbi:MAG: UDP-galactopyranose mutase, partial [Rikenellaceae bacterium]|nr:UDP-galactopyranose mutase [Rikenellaceae bacterium]
FQGNAVVNYTEREVPFTRIIEHKFFDFGTQPSTVITREFPAEFTPGTEPCYPVNDRKNTALYQRYRELADRTPGVLFGGRLAQYAYLDMDDTVEAALALARRELQA